MLMDLYSCPVNDTESLKKYDQNTNNHTKLLGNHFDNIMEIKFLKEVEHTLECHISRFRHNWVKADKKIN